MKILALALVLSLVGCASNPIQEQRRKLFAPEALNTPDSTQSLRDVYTLAKQGAQHSPTKGQVIAFVDAGNALNHANCTAWLSRVTLARRGLIASDHNIGVASALMTTIAGIANWASSSVAALGAAQVALQGFSTNMQNDVLAAPSPYQTQSALLGLLGSCSDQLLIDAPNLKFGQAYSRLETCARTCTHEAAQAAADHALSTMNIVVLPGGALRAGPK